MRKGLLPAYESNRKRKGFTLVELLIVIVIIGILAGSMLLVFGTAKERARASRIISDMRNLKTAAVMYYHEHKTFPPDGGLSDSFARAYMGRQAPESGDQKVWYEFETPGSSDCLVVVNLPENSELKRHLARLSGQSGLYKSDGTTPYGTGADSDKAYMPVALP
ncbi:MAG: type II secretion system protein [Thermovirgaceae bacterium]